MSINLSLNFSDSFQKFQVENKNMHQFLSQQNWIKQNPNLVLGQIESNPIRKEDMLATKANEMFLNPQKKMITLGLDPKEISNYNQNAYIYGQWENPVFVKRIPKQEEKKQKENKTITVSLSIIGKNVIQDNNKTVDNSTMDEENDTDIQLSSIAPPLPQEKKKFELMTGNKSLSLSTNHKIKEQDKDKKNNDKNDQNNDKEDKNNDEEDDDNDDKINKENSINQDKKKKKNTLNNTAAQDQQKKDQKSKTKIQKNTSKKNKEEADKNIPPQEDNESVEKEEEKNQEQEEKQSTEDSEKQNSKNQTEENEEDIKENEKKEADNDKQQKKLKKSKLLRLNSKKNNEE